MPCRPNLSKAINLIGPHALTFCFFCIGMRKREIDDRQHAEAELRKREVSLREAQIEQQVCSVCHAAKEGTWQRFTPFGPFRVCQLSEKP
jgi:hypothetical protein